MPAIGVGLALALTLLARDIRFGARPARRCCADRPLRRCSSSLCAPWIAAELRLYLDGVPVLGWLFRDRGDRLVPGQRAASGGAPRTSITASRDWCSWVPRSSALSRITQTGSPLFLALMVAYGIGNIAERRLARQIAERGWTSWTIRRRSSRGLTWTWLAVLARDAGRVGAVVPAAKT